MNKEDYVKQVFLLVRILPFVAKENCFALKGGTAINLFYRPLPRLSVDIDLMYLPLESRDEAIPKIHAALNRMAEDIRSSMKGAIVEEFYKQSESLRIIVRFEAATVKVELSPVTRGAVFPAKLMRVVKEVEEQFGFVEMQVSSFPDLYAGKICAAMDRQHPRDFADIIGLYENEGITDELRKAFIIYLISHYRPISEILSPQVKNISKVYESEFMHMSRAEISLDALEEVREKLFKDILEQLTERERKFLITFKEMAPQWELLDFDGPAALAQLPAVRWKLQNLEKMDRVKHKNALQKLRNILFK